MSASHDTARTQVVRNDKVWLVTGPLTLISLSVASVFFYLGLMAPPVNQLSPNFRLVVALAVPAVAGFAFWILVTLVTVYELRISADGVTARYLLSRSFTLRWDQINPPTFPYKLRGGGIAFTSSPDAPGVKVMGVGVSDGPGANMPMWMSRALALAILQYPNCPNWDIPDNIWRSLGVDPPRSKSGA